MGRYLKFITDKNGAAAIEFAIIAPVFIMVILTLIAYAIYLSASHSLQQLAADVARTAIAGTTQAERRELVDRYLQTSSLNELLDRTKIRVAVTTDPDRPADFTVTATYDVNQLPIWNIYTFPLPDRVIKRSIAITM